MKEKKININGLRELLLVGVVLLLCVVWTVMNPQFLSVNNITNIFDRRLILLLQQLE